MIFLKFKGLGFDPTKGLYYLSVADALMPGFSPANEMLAALNKIKSGESLTFNNEYAVETLWHEIMHGVTGVIDTNYPLSIEPISEGVVQAIARHSYQLLLLKLGANPAHQAQIIKSGLAYPTVTANLIYLLAKSKIDTGTLIDLVRNGDFSQLKALIAKNLLISPNKVGYLLNLAEQKPIDDFKKKVDVQIKNAQRNKDAS